MATVNLRDLKPTPEAEGLYRRWMLHLNEQFTLHRAADRRSEIVRDELYQIYLGRPYGGKGNAGLTSEMATCLLTDSFDARNVTLEAEYSDAIDMEKYGPRKPLIWFWQMFDRSPLGLNLWLGFRFRCMLGHHIFRKMGKGVRFYTGVQFTYGYNLTIEDNCTFGRGVLLDDRDGDLLVPAGTIVPPWKTIPPVSKG
jgi:hypothetical protein